MKQNLLKKFIDKYSLGGLVDAVIWNVEQNQASVDITSIDKTLLGTVKAKEFEMEDCSFGVYTTAKLAKMLNAMSDDITITPEKIAGQYRQLKMNDEHFKTVYVLADPAIIPQPGKIKKLPEFEVTINADSGFIGKFMTACGAVESDNVAIESNGTQVKFIFGYSNNNTDRISFTVEGQTDVNVDPKLFRVEELKAVLNANSDSEKGMLKLSSRGLMAMAFENEEFETKYFLVQLQNSN